MPISRASRLTYLRPRANVAKIHRRVRRFGTSGDPTFAERAVNPRRYVAPRTTALPAASVGGQWRYVYRTVDQFGQVIDVYVSARRDTEAARRFFHQAIGGTKVMPAEVVTDMAGVYPRVFDESVPAAWHRTDRYANNGIGADHGQLKRRLRPMRGLKTDAGARVITKGHALVQNVRRGHYELAVDVPVHLRVAVAFDELAMAI